MDITEGAVKAIQSTAREAEMNLKAVSFLQGPDPRKQYLVRGKEHTEIPVPPPPRRHTVHTLQDLIAFADQVAELAEAADDTAKLVIWHCHEKVTLVIDDDDRRDTVTFPLEYSSLWTILRQIDEQGTLAFTQKDFVRMLRKDFAVSEAVITEFRKIDFRVLSQSGGEVGRGKESLGKSIEAEVRTGAQELREELDVEAPIYVNPREDQPYRVRLLLDYDATAAKILVSLQADCLAKCELAHQANISTRCGEGESEAAVYFGQP